VCKKCAAYARLEVMGAGLLAPPAKSDVRTHAPLPHLAVRCRKCGHEWMIE
jgi:RNase P subunit RPR2